MTDQSFGKSRELLTAHMVSIETDLPPQGVDYSDLMGIDKTLRSFRQAYGRRLGLTSIGGHIALPDQKLIVVAHVDGIEDDAGDVVPYVSRIVEAYGIPVPDSGSLYSIQTEKSLPEAS